MNIDFIRSFKKIIFLLTSHEKKKAILLMIMLLVMALLDTIGVASIMPFMAVLMNPEIIETNIFLNKLFDFFTLFGVNNNKQFLFVLGVFVFILLLLSLFFKALTTYAQMRFTYMREYTLSRRLVEKYLHQPYDWFLNRHSADLGKTVLSEVDQVVSKGLNTLINLIAHCLVAFTLFILLVLVDLKLTLIVTTILGSAYLLIYKFTRGILKITGKERMEANQWRFTAVSEAFGAIKEIKVGGLEHAYTQRFSVPAKNYGLSQLSAQIVIQLPRYALEAIAFGGLLLIALYLMTIKGSFVNALPIMTLYAFAGYRLMPSLQQIYNAISALRFVSLPLETMYNEMKNLESKDFSKDQKNIKLEKKIVLNNISYHYPNTSKTALKKIYFEIPVNSKVGIVGVTGGGKTTTVDIIMGLLNPQKGTLEIDGKIVNNDNRRAWQSLIGYVPQQIFLADDTIAANIAFGIDAKHINKQSLEYAAKIANLHDFVIGELPQQYHTYIGERGVRLSGGQRQRIGIARALYHKPKVLILDEATSALDNLTEKIVMDAVDNLGSSMTIILIAHRLSTVKKCDNIFLLENGELKGQGTYEKLIQVNESFRKTAFNK